MRMYEQEDQHLLPHTLTCNVLCWTTESLTTSRPMVLRLPDPTSQELSGYSAGFPSSTLARDRSSCTCNED
jgi:hypothetical protein